MQYPNLIILGQAKAGTTSLHSLIAQHPNIHSNNAYKDYMFFSNNDRFKRIRELIKEYSGQKYILDTGATYCIKRSALEKIKQYCGSAKFIFIFRDPVERWISDYYFRYYRGRINLSETQVLSMSFSEIESELPGLTRLSRLGEQLQMMDEVIGLDSIYLISFEDFSKDTGKVLNEIWEFLDLPLARIPFGHKNKTNTPKYRFLGWLLFGKHNLEALKRFIPKNIRSSLVRIVSKHNVSSKPQILRTNTHFKSLLYEGLKNDIKLATQKFTDRGMHVDYLSKYI